MKKLLMLAIPALLLVSGQAQAQQQQQRQRVQVQSNAQIADTIERLSFTQKEQAIRLLQNRILAFDRVINRLEAGGLQPDEEERAELLRDRRENLIGQEEDIREATEDNWMRVRSNVASDIRQLDQYLED